jgi:hypothetical protein
MVDVPDFIDVPIFGGSASKIEPSPTIYANGFLPGQVFPAENENWFMNGLTGNGVTEQDSIVSLVTEMVNFLSAYSVTPNPALFNQFITTFQAQLALKGSLAGPTHFTGITTIDTVPAPTSGGNPTTKTYVDTALLSKADLASPEFTGTPTAPTPSALDNSTKVATSAYVDSADMAKPAIPITAAGAGQFKAFSVANNANITLPAGGHWAWVVFWTPTTYAAFFFSFSGVSPGGTTVNTTDSGHAAHGFYWRID